ncbi:MAG: indolepyruvate oxidoreductase subunit beta [Dehalococcoidia bacterium]|nr:MAG: indolepyruvate oxidoreductase subunit beta [Dehalococcoidia bacterium]
MIKLNIIITGVAGQGVELAGDIIEEVARERGLDVKKKDNQGISQRDGSIITRLSVGEDASAASSGEGEADILLAFEKVEAARCSEYLRNGGIAIVNDMAVARPSVNPGSEAYPDDAQILYLLSLRSAEVMVIEASLRATESGNPDVLSTVMLGALSMLTPFNPDLWEKVIARKVPPGTLDVNLAAFGTGRREMLRILDGVPGEGECSGHEHDDDCGCH